MLSWDSTFPDRRDVMVLGPLPIRSRTIFLAKVAAVATALSVTVPTLHFLAGLVWPLALAQFDSMPAPAFTYDPALAPVRPADLPAVINRDIAPSRRLDGAVDGGAGSAIGVWKHGVQRVFAYGTAKPDSIFEIGSITKTFTGLMLAQMVVQGHWTGRTRARITSAGQSAADERRSKFHCSIWPRISPDCRACPITPDRTTSASRTPTIPRFRSLRISSSGTASESPPSEISVQQSGLHGARGGAGQPRGNQLSGAGAAGEITGPLGMKDTVDLALAGTTRPLATRLRLRSASPTPALGSGLAPPPALAAFAPPPADMLTYLEAQLHPANFRLFAAALDGIPSPSRLTSLAMGASRLPGSYDPGPAAFTEHDGATGGFTSFAILQPTPRFRRGGSGEFPLAGVSHLRVSWASTSCARLSGEPAFSLAARLGFRPAGPIRAFFAYWIAMIAAGAFMFCCVLGLQGVAAQLLPPPMVSARLRRFCSWPFSACWSCGYFYSDRQSPCWWRRLRQSWISCNPFPTGSSRFYQQLSGSCIRRSHLLRWRAWIGLEPLISGSPALAYAASYFRTLRKIVEEPDIAPGVRSPLAAAFRSGHWRPRSCNSAFEVCSAAASTG